jgi:imidazolonepropionase
MPLQLYRNAKIYTPVDRGTPNAGRDQDFIASYEKGALLVQDGLISQVGNEEDVQAGLETAVLERAYDCRGRCLIPGFVDPHTHNCFAALRESEFEQRLAGTSYLEILERGGGILSSVKTVADADVDELYSNTRRQAFRALASGTTTMEIKSGYGLDTANELKMLEAIGRVAEDSPMDVVATFLGAHAVPHEYKGRADDFIALVISEMLPAVKEQGIARQCDIFCEKGVFSIEQGRLLLSTAREMDLKVKIHADEVNDLGGAGLAAELNALSADHLLAASDENIEAMARVGVIATLLPATAYSLRKPYARARTMIEKNLAVALATDCNPGSSYTESMPFVIGLAVLNMNMSPAEALTGATLNAAYAIDMAHKVGSLDIGKQADFLILEGDSPGILAYHAGATSVTEVYKKGRKIDF